MNISEIQHESNAKKLVCTLQSKLKKILDSIDSKEKISISKINIMIVETNESLHALMFAYKKLNNIMSNHSLQKILVVKDSLQKTVTKATKMLPYYDPIKGNKIMPKSETKLLREILSKSF